jgi:hypothetical protein
MVINQKISKNILFEEKEEEINSEDKLRGSKEEDNHNNNNNNKDTSSGIAEDVYGEKVKSTIQRVGGVNNLTFLDTLELEYVRVEQGLLPRQRDSVLLNMEIEIENLNPDKFINSRDEKTETSLRKSSKYKNSKCTECNESLGLLRQRQCTYCYKRYCSNCMSSSQAKVHTYIIIPHNID